MDSTPSLHMLLSIHEIKGKISEQLTLLGWGSSADLVKNRRVLCSYFLKNDAILMCEPLIQKVRLSR